MKHKLIKTTDYFLVVDDSEIKKDNWYYNVNGIFRCDNQKTGQDELSLSLLTKWNKKIIAHLSLNNSPILEGVDLLPPLEDDVEKLAKQFANDKMKEYVGSCYADREYLRQGYITGYNKAKETYKYTEEDLRKAYNKGTNQGAFHEMLVRDEDWKAVDGFIKNDNSKVDKFIQSLQQPKLPVEFECEMKKNLQELSEFSPIPSIEVLIIKTTTNSQGQKVWIGKYHY